MSARELSRTPQGDGFTLVTVSLPGPRVGTVVVPSDMVDQPGYQDMLDQVLAKHESLIAIRDGGVPL